MNSLCEQTYILIQLLSFKLIQLLYVYVIIVELKRCLVFVLRITQRKSDVKTDLSTVTLKMKIRFWYYDGIIQQSSISLTLCQKLYCALERVFSSSCLSVFCIWLKEQKRRHLTSLSKFQCQNYHRCIYDRGTDRFAEFSRSLHVESGY